MLAILLVVATLFAVAACGTPAETTAPSGDNGGNNNPGGNGGNNGGNNDGTTDGKGHKDPKMYTYNTYTALSPSNWNELTYQDENDTQVMGYIGSSFYTYDFKFDEYGEIIPGEFVMKYDAATKLEDVSSKYVGEKWGIEEGEKGKAYKITLRNDLKWDDGTPIKAADFVYTMKEQLDPLAQHYRADSFYSGALVLVNAENYVKQGQTLITDNSNTEKYAIADLVKGENGAYTQPDGGAIYFSLKDKLAYLQGDTVEDYAGYLDKDSYEALAALADADGHVAVTDETIALWTTLIDTKDWGNEGPDMLPNYLVYNYTYGAVKFENVGIMADGDYGIILILANPLDLLKEDGSLSYKAAYNMASLPLVHKAKWEANKVAPSEGVDLWTSTYNTSVESTASWGPYKLESFQAGRQYTLVRNDTWYGYNMKDNEGAYQTDRIVCDTIKEWNSAWLAFQAGEIDGIGIDVTIAEDYKNSERAYFTPDDFVASLQLQSNKTALKDRESEGVNKTLLAYTDFRKALSLAIDRADFAATTTTSSLAGFGLFNSMHYYDVENGGVYRNTDYAKKVLCDIYAVDPANYGGDLDKAVAAITGYNLAEARKLLTKAYNEALAAGDIKEGDKVVLTGGSGAINDIVTRRFKYIAQEWADLAVGTPLEGKLILSNPEDFGTAWAKDFRAGAYDVCMGGWSGAAWDPGYFLAAYLSPANMYSQAWDTSSVMMEFTMKGVGKDGGDITETMSLMDWYDCLNGATDAKYNWSATAIDNSLRLQLIAALEKEVLKVYYSVPLYNSFTASLISFKVDYVTYEYNTFMGYGGMKYMTFNYDDDGWAAAVQAEGGELNYK